MSGKVATLAAWVGVLVVAGMAGGDQSATAPAGSGGVASAATTTAPTPTRPTATAAVPSTDTAVAPAGAVTIDGESFPGQLTGLSASEAVFRTEQGVRKVALSNLWQVRAAEHAEPLAARGQRVALVGGDNPVAFDSLSAASGKFTLEGGKLGKVVLDVSAISTIYLPVREQTPLALDKRRRELDLPKANVDFLIAEDAKGRWLPIPGVLKSIEGGKVLFEYGGQDRAADLGGIRMIQLAPMAKKPPVVAGLLTCTDGSTVPFAELTFSGGKFSARSDVVEASAVASDAVAEIRFQSDRFVYLSDLKPVKVVQAGLFDVVFPVRADRSTVGSALRIGRTSYAKGVGMHSRCELTYDLDGKYALLAALAGIDESAGIRGNATVRITGDGRELCKPVQVCGGGPAAPVRCDVTGVRQLLIVADFGDDNTDIGDHVDLAEARLIRP